MSVDEVNSRRYIRKSAVRLVGGDQAINSGQGSGEPSTSLASAAPSSTVAASGTSAKFSKESQRNMPNGEITNDNTPKGNLTNGQLASNKSIKAEPSTTRTAPILAEITLKVGEKLFTTTTTTLSKSKYFATLFASRAALAIPDLLTHQPDYIFVDADPILFTHTLRYLRTGVFPLLYSPKTGHDYLKYAELLAQAKFLGIPPLIKWLRDECFLSATTQEWKVTTYEGEQGIQNISHGPSRSAYEKYWVHTSWYTKETYICPRGVPVHYGQPDKCGKLCRAIGEAEGSAVDEEEIPRITVVSRAVKFNGSYFGMGVQNDGA